MAVAGRIVALLNLRHYYVTKLQFGDRYFPAERSEIFRAVVNPTGSTNVTHLRHGLTHVCRVPDTTPARPVRRCVSRPTHLRFGVTHLCFAIAQVSFTRGNLVDVQL